MKFGDKLTAVDGGLLVHVRFVSLDKMIYTHRFSLAGHIDGPDLNPQDEGAAWCRGHVTETDEAGAALLAAAAMVERQVMTIDGVEVNMPGDLLFVAEDESRRRGFEFKRFGPWDDE